uniref:PH01B031C15.16 protein n=1 Tax=Phyllostachys edulis TaxID=38705 RepID=L0P3Y1_PHYED|nr:PH01B031C15.16 [Phyllostachys edulis]
MAIGDRRFKNAITDGFVSRLSLWCNDPTLGHPRGPPRPSGKSIRTSQEVHKGPLGQSTKTSQEVQQDLLEVQENMTREGLGAREHPRACHGQTKGVRGDPWASQVHPRPPEEVVED